MLPLLLLHLVVTADITTGFPNCCSGPLPLMVALGSDYYQRPEEDWPCWVLQTLVTLFTLKYSWFDSALFVWCQYSLYIVMYIRGVIRFENKIWNNQQPWQSLKKCKIRSLRSDRLQMYWFHNIILLFSLFFSILPI